MNRKEQTIDDKVANLMIQQLGIELYNHNVYRTFASFCYQRGLTKLYEYYEHRAFEEYNHHNWLVDYLTQNGIDFNYPTIPAIKKEHVPTTIKFTFEATVELEIETTQEIQKMVDEAQKLNDDMTATWIKKTLLAEQNEEETISRFILNISEIESDMLSIQDAILDYYNNRESINNQQRNIIE